MENLIWGILVIGVSGFILYKAWLSMQKGKMNLAIGLLTIAGLILRVYVASDMYLHSWDERYHALVAKHLIQNPLQPMLYLDPILPYDFKVWIGNHIWVHKQPLPLWSMALSIWAFGTNEIAVRLPSIVLSTISIIATYGIGKELYNKNVGFVAAFLFSIHGLVIELTGGRVTTDHFDVAFLSFITLAVYFSILFFKKQKTRFTIFTGMFVGAAILSKWLPALIVIPVWGTLYFHFRTVPIKQVLIQLGLLLLTIIVVVMPWQLYARYHYPDEYVWEMTFNALHLTTVIENQSGEWYYHLNKLRMLFGELIYLPIGWFMYKTISKKCDFRDWAIVTWFAIPYLFFSFIATKMQGYILFTAPAIFLMSAVFFEYLRNNKDVLKYPWIAKLVMILLLALPIRYSIERIKPFEKRDRNPAWTQEIKRLNNIDTAKKSVIFNMPHPIETMFYTDFIAYEELPTLASIQVSIDKGYTVYLYETNTISDEVMALKDVVLIDLKK